MKFVADVDAGLVERIEDRLPALGQFLERGLDEFGRALGPGIHIRPGQRARECHVARQAQVTRRLGPFHHLIDRPFLALGGLAVDLLRREGVERLVVSRVDRDQLPLQMRRELGDRQTMARRCSLELVAIGLRRRGLGEIEQPVVPGRNLHALVAERRRPLAHARERIERRRVAGELRQKNRRTLDHASHDPLPRIARSSSAPPSRKKGKRANALPRLLPYQNGEFLK